LPRRPAVWDNAATPTEPPNAEPPRRKSHWYQFSLRTFLIAISLLAAISGYVARQYEIVQERQRFVDEGRCCAGSNPNFSDVPWIRSLLGDQGRVVVGLDENTDKAERQRVAALFPEAQICALRFERIPGATLDSCSVEYAPFRGEPPAPSPNAMSLKSGK
jgi:hypothetical protein